LLYALPAAQGVPACAATDRVVSGEAGELVVSAEAGNHVLTGGAHADVIALSAHDRRLLALTGSGGRTRGQIDERPEDLVGPTPAGGGPRRTVGREPAVELARVATGPGAKLEGVGGGPGDRDGIGLTGKHRRWTREPCADPRHAGRHVAVGDDGGADPPAGPPGGVGGPDLDHVVAGGSRLIDLELGSG